MPMKILCHGGVSNRSPNLKAKQKDVDRAADAGMATMTQGGSALDAVVEAVSIMEDSPLCNAGTGSFIQMDGQVRMDAALMDQDLNIGSVIQISEVKNPIRVARTILDCGVHSILQGSLASDWAHRMGHAYFDPRTEQRVITWLEQWQQTRHLDTYELILTLRDKVESGEMLGTVGAVALDDAGRMAAGTSTGGLKLDMPGRVGDVPLIGCGTYCNAFGAVSCTGTGERIIKVVLAKQIVDALEHGRTLEEALDAALDKMTQIQGLCGFIVVTPSGGVGYRFNTEAMAMTVREAP